MSLANAVNTRPAPARAAAPPSSRPRPTRLGCAVLAPPASAQPPAPAPAPSPAPAAHRAPPPPLSPPPRALAADGRSFSELLAVRVHEAGPDGCATPLALSNLLQEVAANHAQALWGPGAWAPAEMRAASLAFALAKLSLRLAPGRPLRWGHTARLTTWFDAASSLAARRDWVIEDAASGLRMGEGTSTWLAFNLNTRRVARLPPAARAKIFSEAGCSDAALGAGFVAEKVEDWGDAAGGEPGRASRPARVRLADIDMNGHVNNASFMAWVMDDVPPCLRACSLAGFDLEFRACVFWRENVVLRLFFTALTRRVSRRSTQRGGGGGRDCVVRRAAGRRRGGVLGRAGHARGPRRLRRPAAAHAAAHAAPHGRRGGAAAGAHALAGSNRTVRGHGVARRRARDRELGGCSLLVRMSGSGGVAAGGVRHQRLHSCFKACIVVIDLLLTKVLVNAAL